MKKIGLLSDTHSFLHPKVFSFFNDCDEIWHAGDIGNKLVIEQLDNFKPLRAVYGNIDGVEIRTSYPEILKFEIENIKVFITHIGGYPTKYNKKIKDELSAFSPQLFICGHSH